MAYTKSNYHYNYLESELPTYHIFSKYNDNDFVLNVPSYII